MEGSTIRRAEPLLGAIVDITAEGAEDILPAAIEAAFASVEQVHRLMSFHEPDSDVSHINLAEPGCEINVSPHTIRVLHFARQLSDLSCGLFDITIASILVENSFLPRPLAQLIPVEATTYRDLLLMPDNRVLWRRKGWIDLGGIAKGYAVDCATAALRSHGVTAAIIAAGGELRCFGTPQPIYLPHPSAPTTLMSIGSLRDSALATSAGSLSHSDPDARESGPLVDPWRRRCATWNGSVSVAAPDGMTADALIKVVGLAPDFARDIVDQLGAQAIVINEKGLWRFGRDLLHPI